MAKISALLKIENKRTITKICGQALEIDWIAFSKETFVDMRFKMIGKTPDTKKPMEFIMAKASEKIISRIVLAGLAISR